MIAVTQRPSKNPVNLFFVRLARIDSSFPPGELLKPVAHHIHSVKKQSQSSEQSQKTKKVHLIFLLSKCLYLIILIIQHFILYTKRPVRSIQKNAP